MVVLEVLIASYSVGMLILVILNYAFLPRVESNLAKENPKVSVLIPARNESQNLSSNLPLWLAQDYPNFEILVLNDQSEDSTDQILQSFANQIIIMQGLPLPKGWLGKNWACHQLSQAASGDLFLFVDADVSPEQRAISVTVSTLEKYQLRSFSAFLKQSFAHWSSKAVIPWAFQFPVLAWAPLFLNRFFRFSRLAIGNGQWFVFEKQCYLAMGGHEAVKSSVIEDMALAKLLFTKGFRYQPFIAPELATVHMYKDAEDLTEGLTKNLSFIFGPTLFENFFFFILFVGLLGTLAFKQGIFFLIVLLSFYIAQFTFKQKNVSPILVPFGIFLTLFLFLRSLTAKKRKTISWKGRAIT